MILSVCDDVLFSTVHPRNAHNQMDEEPDIYKLDQHHRHRDIISNESEKLTTILSNLTTEKRYFDKIFKTNHYAKTL
jgi:hypothetical protein